jgi:hypothetical protein
LFLFFLGLFLLDLQLLLLLLLSFLLLELQLLLLQLLLARLSTPLVTLIGAFVIFNLIGNGSKKPNATPTEVLPILNWVQILRMSPLRGIIQTFRVPDLLFLAWNATNSAGAWVSATLVRLSCIILLRSFEDDVPRIHARAGILKVRSLIFTLCIIN